MISTMLVVFARPLWLSCLQDSTLTDVGCKVESRAWLGKQGKQLYLYKEISSSGNSSYYFLLALAV